MSALREVIQKAVEKQKQLDVADDQISQMLRDVQEAIKRQRPGGHPVDVPFPPWGKLGWSGRRGRWRLVVIDEDECEDLLSMPRLCRADACHVLRKLAERMGLLKT